MKWRRFLSRLTFRSWKPFVTPCAVMAIAGLPGCSGATGQIPEVQPTVVVSGAPKDALLFVDGKAAGPVCDASGSAKAVSVTSGSHIVEMRPGGAVLKTQQIYVAGDGVAEVAVK